MLPSNLPMDHDFDAACCQKFTINRNRCCDCAGTGAITLLVADPAGFYHAKAKCWLCDGRGSLDHLRRLWRKRFINRRKALPGSLVLRGSVALATTGSNLAILPEVTDSWLNMECIRPQCGKMRRRSGILCQGCYGRMPLETRIMVDEHFLTSCNSSPPAEFYQRHGLPTTRSHAPTVVEENFDREWSASYWAKRKEMAHTLHHTTLLAQQRRGCDWEVDTTPMHFVRGDTMLPCTSPSPPPLKRRRQ